MPLMSVMAIVSMVAAVPNVIFSVWHNISGPILAIIFGRMKDKDESVKEDESKFKVKYSAK